MKELLFTAILAVHVLAFARLFFRRGRHRFDLLFVGGFLLLTIFYAGRSWLALAGIEPEPTYLPVVRWSGFALCGLATPPFLIHWYQRRRGYRGSSES